MAVAAATLNVLARENLNSNFKLQFGDCKLQIAYKISACAIATVVAQLLFGL